MTMSGISKIEIITGMSKLSSLIEELSKVGVRGITVMQVLGCGVEMGTQEYEVDQKEVMELLPKQQINIVAFLLIGSLVVMGFIGMLLTGGTFTVLGIYSILWIRYRMKMPVFKSVPVEKVMAMENELYYYERQQKGIW